MLFDLKSVSLLGLVAVASSYPLEIEARADTSTVVDCGGQIFTIEDLSVAIIAAKSAPSGGEAANAYPHAFTDDQTLFKGTAGGAALSEYPLVAGGVWTPGHEAGNYTLVYNPESGDIVGATYHEGQDAVKACEKKSANNNVARQEAALGKLVASGGRLLVEGIKDVAKFFKKTKHVPNPTNNNDNNNNNGNGQPKNNNAQQPKNGKGKRAEASPNVNGNRTFADFLKSVIKYNTKTGKGKRQAPPATANVAAADQHATAKTAGLPASLVTNVFKTLTKTTKNVVTDLVKDKIVNKIKQKADDKKKNN